MSTNAESGCGRGDNKYVKEIHFLHSFPGLFPNCPQFARKRRVRNTTRNTARTIYTHSKNTYLLLHPHLPFLHHTITTANTEKKKKSTDIIHATMRSLTFSQA